MVGAPPLTLQETRLHNLDLQSIGGSAFVCLWGRVGEEGGTGCWKCAQFSPIRLWLVVSLLKHIPFVCLRELRFIPA